MTKADIQRIKGEAITAYGTKDYKLCFSHLKRLSPIDFIIFSEKKSWLYKGACASYFWNEWLLSNNQYFHKLFTSPLRMQLLYNYFSRTELFSKKIEKKIVLEYPEIFINAVRKNKVFLREHRIKFLLDEIVLPEHLIVHKDVWEYFYSQEMELWEAIQKHLKIIIKYSINGILGSLIKTIEEINYKLNTRLDKQLLGDTYSFFMEMLLCNQTIKNVLNSTDTETFKGDFFEQLITPNLDLDSAVNKCVVIIYNRTSLMLNHVDNYSFNDTITPQYIYESVYFVEDPISYYNWKKDGARYPLMEALYYNKGMELVEAELEYNPDFKIKNRKKEDYEDNKELAERLNGILIALQDLKLDTFFYGIKDEETLPIDKIISPIFGFAYSKYIRYDKQIKALKNNPLVSESWQKSYAYLIMNNPTIEIMPFIYMSKQEYYELNGNVINNVNKNITSHIINLFSETIGDEPFNRFKITYSVFTSPFITFGAHLFCPVSFFTAFSSIYTNINRLLNYKAGKTGKAVETSLCNALKKHKFNTIRTDELNKKMDGDADLVVYDEDTVLLIQVKRTKLRFDFKTQYDEFITIDSHAANQLNEAETFLKGKNRVFKIGNRKVKKWIVSNSFEKINTNIEGCLKVNYLELMMFLNNTEGMTFNTLQDFIDFNEADAYYKTTAKATSVFKEHFELDEISKYVYPVFSFDTNKANKYRHYCNKGLKLNKEENHKAAIKAFNYALQLEGEDVEVHGAIANVYADMKSIQNASIHFKKALQLLPNDPFISRNYIGLIFENGEAFKALNLSLELIKVYPLIDELKEQFDNMFYVSLTINLVNKKEIEIIKGLKKEVDTFYKIKTV